MVNTYGKYFLIHAASAYVQGGIVAGTGQARGGQRITLQWTTPGLHRPGCTLVYPKLALCDGYKNGQPFVALIGTLRAGAATGL